MIAVLVTFKDLAGLDRELLAQVAAGARGTFEGLDGLRSKAFTVAEDGRSARNFYVWDDAGTARAFFTDELRDRIEELYGVAPEVDFLEVLELVENA